MTSRTGGPGRYQLLKMGLIPGLAFTLYYVMLDGIDDAPTAPPPSAGVATLAASELPVPSRDAVPILATVRPVEQIAGADPFALPDELLPPPAASPVSAFLDNATGAAAAEPEPELDGWEGIEQRWGAERVSVVLTTPKGLVAVVGDRMLRVGDELEEGFRVAEIRADGITIEAVDHDE